MALPALAALAFDIGAPIIGNLLRRSGGPTGEIAASTIEKIADQLGTEPNEEAIMQHHERRPDDVASVLRGINGDLARMAEAASDANQSYHRLLKGDRDSVSLLSRAWRPFNGFAFGLEAVLIVVTVCVAIWRGDADTLKALQPLYAFLGTVLGAHASVVGVYVWRRTDEKLGERA